ncbi:MAG: L-rhamnose isomerase [Candidatus Aminicenantes bacterium]|jgi:L-rhamnose isomerase
MNAEKIKEAYTFARQQYADLGVDTEKAVQTVGKVSLSLPCWQGDDVRGFEMSDTPSGGGGIQATGSYPGKARTHEELRMDLDKAFSLIPGQKRLNLHAMYGDFEEKPVDRNEIEPEHYFSWIDWAKKRNIKLDFNATCFSHPRAESGFTLSSKDKKTREFWIEHVKRCRKISAQLGQSLESPCIHNLWIPDGTKDSPVDRWTHRELLKQALDEIYAKKYSSREMKDAVESKLFGIGSESFVVGSHEFYMGYALSKGIMLCLDLGHFHPTESIGDKISAILQFFEELLLHFSRGVRWDSDHVVNLNDEVKSISEEIVRSNVLERVHFALDFFDASMNRIGAWIIGARATLKSVLIALLEPRRKLQEFEDSGNHFARLALLEELKTMPFGAVWDYFCLKMDVPSGESWIEEIDRYDAEVTRKRS